MLPTANAQYPFIVLGFCYGVGTSLAELGAYAMLTQIASESGNVGGVIAVAEVRLGWVGAAFSCFHSSLGVLMAIDLVTTARTRHPALH